MGLDSVLDALDPIAIIGMAIRFPGAKNIDEFWQNLCNGVESITFFTDEELLSSGVAPSLLEKPNYVKAHGTIGDIAGFDSAFFGLSPLEAEVMDPQHRLLLECGWEALENAGYNTETYDGQIGVYAGVGFNQYLLKNLAKNHELLDSVSDFSIFIGNDKDFAPTRISYKLNLTGPSVNVNTACSTSLVAVHLACQGLLNYQCDMALAGSASIRVPQKAGYLYHTGDIFSPDGHCRAFDAQAQGTIDGSGLGIVVLKRLSDAIADGDCIHAVIKGSAINNDGSLKVGYTAPSVERQAAAIAEAQSIAGIEAKTVTYIEAHGTGTALGDPIEIAALTQVFRASSQNNHFCAIGSVKTNFGHLDTAAGIAGLIKTVLALKHKRLPPTLHFERPNPKIDLSNSPFYVNTNLLEWKTNGTPRRAGVSSFGIGGTNAHVVLEEAPTLEPSQESRPWQLLVISAQTSSALDIATASILEHFERYPNINLADVAFTLNHGRKAFKHRRALVCQTLQEAATALKTQDPQRVFSAVRESEKRPVVFMFPGQGSQYVNMGWEIYQNEPIFRHYIEQCSEILNSQFGWNLCNILYPPPEQEGAAAEKLKQTAITQPALFAVEYALAQLWMQWGVHPHATIGHSVGEYVAACLAGVFSLPEALVLVAKRGQLMQQLPPGTMLSVPLPAKEVEPFLSESLSLAAINGPSLCVVSGTLSAVEALQKHLAQQRVECHRLHTSHAFHSIMMEPILTLFRQQINKITLHPPQIPYVSNLTGNWVTAAEVTDPEYWVRHLRQTVQFADGLQQLCQGSEQIMLEVGPGHTLSTLTKEYLGNITDKIVLTSIRHPKDRQSDIAFLLKTLSNLWLAGVDIDWSGFYRDEHRHRLPLPTYPFEHQHYWIDPAKEANNTSYLHKSSNIADWFYIPSWRRKPLLSCQNGQTQMQTSVLVFVDECGLGSKLVKQLKLEGQDVVTVRIGSAFSFVNKSQDGKQDDEQNHFEVSLNPRQRGDYDALLQQLRSLGKYPKTIVHMWGVTPQDNIQSPLLNLEKSQDLGFYSLLFLTQALGKQNVSEALQITIVSNNLQDVTGEEVVCPEKATVLGPVRVIPQEYPHISCRSLDVVFPDQEAVAQELVEQLLCELRSNAADPIVAYRGKYRWIQTFEQVPLQRHHQNRLKEAGVYLIIGGLGGIGFVLAEHLAKTVKAKLILTGRSAFPQPEEWDTWLLNHDDQDSVSRKIKKIEELERLSAEVLVQSVDVTDEQQMLVAIAQAKQRFGKIDGVILAAGVPGGGMTQHKQPEEAAKILAPKVKGALVLDHLLKDVKLDFFILVSSITSILGEFGQVDYAAANAFLDAFSAYQNSKKGFLTIAINWDIWQEVGMAARTSVPLELQDLYSQNLQQGILPQEGIEVFDCILGNMTPLIFTQVLISTRDFQLRREQESKHQAKLFREALEKVNSSKPLHQRPKLSNTYVAPRNEFEQKVALIWQKLLGIETIGIYDNFFELGGHSLLATQIVLRLENIFQVELTPHYLFEEPTVANLAQRIEKICRTSVPNSTLEPIYPAIGNGEPLPLSWAQERLWFLCQLEGLSAAYNIPLAVQLTGKLEIATLEQAFTEIVRRHEILRTVFPTVNGTPTQVIVAPTAVTIPVMDLRSLLESEQTAKVQQMIAQEQTRSFDLATDSLLHITLLQLGELSHVLLVTMHHIISDDWSIGLFIQELSTLYQAFQSGASTPLPELPIQYADFTVWQRRWLSGEVLETQLNYWKKQLADSTALLELPTDRPRRMVQSLRGSTETFVLNTDLTQKLKHLSQQAGATLFMTLLAAFALLLSRYSNQEDIVIGSPIANRNRQEIEPLIGFFVNTLVLRIDLQGNPTFRELLLRVRQMTLDAFTHQDLPFEHLVETLQPKRSLSNHPLFQVMFVLQNAPIEVLDLPGLTMTPLELPQTFAQFDLNLSLIEANTELMGMWKYNSDLFEASTIRRMMGHFQMLLEGILADPDVRVAQLPLLTEQELHQLLIKWNNSQTNYPKDKCIHQLFEEQVQRTPDALAVIFEQQHITYAELNARANQLANYLQTLGVGTEVLVGICVERSIEMLVGLLGILKTGGAYVPLDPDYPPERLSFMLADSQVSVLLTQHKFLTQLHEQTTQLICLDTDCLSISQASDRNPSCKVYAENSAYVIYTSGSTGQPKGVVNTHRGIVNRLLWMQETYQLTAAERVLQKTPFSFDVSVWEFFWPLLTGSCVVIAQPGKHKDSAYLVEFIAKQQITTLHFVPSMLQIFLEEPDIEACACLRQVFCSGEALPFDLTERFFARLQCELHNLYGPTNSDSQRLPVPSQDQRHPNRHQQM
ncbi:hypothetical protein NUACC21_66050 [Scytonema sp. NUACC21]